MLHFIILSNRFCSSSISYLIFSIHLYLQNAKNRNSHDSPKLILDKRKPSMTVSLTWRLRYLFNATIVLQIPSVIFLYYVIIREISVSDLHMKSVRECLWACLWFLGFFCTDLFVERNNCVADNFQSLQIKIRLICIFIWLYKIEKYLRPSHRPINLLGDHGLDINFKSYETNDLTSNSQLNKTKT